ncbi:MAG: hypothetical protein RLZZ344_1119 [Pseudomonadota bacterium]|jgi:hypothetical protein
MKTLKDDQTLVFAAESSAAAQLLAFAVFIRQHDLRQIRFWVRIPRPIFQAIPADQFKEIFSDLMLEDDPDIERRMRVFVSAEPGFGLGLEALGAGGGGLPTLDGATA